MPEFKEFEADRVARKDEELAPYIEEAFKRKAERNEMMAELNDADIPVYEPYGFEVVQSETETAKLNEQQRAQLARFEEMKKVADLAVRLGASD